MILPLDKGKRKFVRIDCKIQKIKKCHLKKRKKYYVVILKEQ